MQACQSLSQPGGKALEQTHSEYCLVTGCRLLQLGQNSHCEQDRSVHVRQTLRALTGGSWLLSHALVEGKFSLEE